jgi:ribosomal protein S18 acetylase RimI-like enzyme
MLHIVQRNRDAYLPLLLLADPEENRVRRYLSDGELFSWLNEEDETVGVVHVTEQASGSVEINNVAVRDAFQGQGHGKRFMEAVLKMLKERGCQEVSVRTGNSSIGNLAFYQKLGFRMMEIEHDYFTKEYAEPITENGIKCRDRILFVKPLS